MLIETLYKELQIYFSEETEIFIPSSNTTLIFLRFFGSKGGIWNMIMLIQILSEL